MSNKTIDRYKTFWAHEDTDKPMLNIIVEDKKAIWEDNAPKTPRDRWENLEARYTWSRMAMKNTKIFGDAVYSDWVNFGPGCLSAMMGSNYVPDENTIWFGRDEFFLTDWSKLENLRLQKDSPMYKMVTEMTRMLTERNDGSYYTGVSDLGGNLDILASLRSTWTLLTDLHDDPEMVLKAVEIIDEAWMECYSTLRAIINNSGQSGHTTWLGPWCGTAYYPLQCDFAAMISPEDFARFVMPSLRRASDFLDHSIFHLDGPEQIVHLDQLLSVERIDGIQWVPGDGKPPVFDKTWFPMYEKIQAAGKCLVLHGFNHIEDILFVTKNLSPKGLWLYIWLGSEAEAEELLKKI